MIQDLEDSDELGAAPDQREIVDILMIPVRNTASEASAPPLPLWTHLNC